MAVGVKVSLMYFRQAGGAQGHWARQGEAR